AILGQRDQRDLAAVGGFAEVGGAAVGVVGFGLRIGVLAERFDSGEASQGEAGEDIGFEVEHAAVGAAAVGEEAFVFRVGLGEAGEEGEVHFVGTAGDAGADRGGDPGAVGAEFFHAR